MNEMLQREGVKSFMALTRLENENDFSGIVKISNGPEYNFNEEYQNGVERKLNCKMLVGNYDCTEVEKYWGQWWFEKNYFVA